MKRGGVLRFSFGRTAFPASALRDVASPSSLLASSEIFVELFDSFRMCHIHTAAPSTFHLLERRGIGVMT